MTPYIVTQEEYARILEAERRQIILATLEDDLREERRREEELFAEDERHQEW